jgi:hypothetical protein
VKKRTWLSEIKSLLIKFEFKRSINPHINHFYLDLYCGIGAYLFQAKGEIHYPIRFISKTLTAAQQKWNTTEKEAYAIVYAFNKLEYLLRDTKFTLCTDHKNLTYVDKDPRPRVQRWKLAMQEFDFQIIHIPGKENIVADGLSRHCHEQRKEELLRTK